MGMEINSAYNNYASAYASEQSSKTTRSNNMAGTAGKANAAKETGAAKQTQSMQDYLKSLQDKYPDVNITVGKNTTAKSFMGYMLGSSGTNNIYIEDNIIQKMASDPAYAAKYEKVIADAPKAGKEIKESLESMGLRCLASGTQIDEKGRVTYWSVSYNPNAEKHNAEIRAERQKSEQTLKDTIEASRKKKKEQTKKVEEKRVERKKEEKERMELLIFQGESAEDVISKLSKGETEVVSAKTLDGIASIGFDVKA